MNRRQKHKFIMSAMLFGFCMARILTCSLRIGVAYHHSNVSLQIAAMIFLNAGILIVYIVNLLFAQRVLRARQPEIGWHPLFRACSKLIYGLIGLALVLLITFIVIQFYTLDATLRQACRDIQLVAITYLLFVAILPLFILAGSWCLPMSPNGEGFGVDKELRLNNDPWSLGQKSLVLAVSAALCTLGAGFKAGANFESPRPRNDPGWYQSRAALYVFSFLIEIIILYLYLWARIDRRFHVPDGSSEHRSFTRAAAQNLVAESLETAERMLSQPLSLGTAKRISSRPFSRHTTPRNSEEVPKAPVV